MAIALRFGQLGNNTKAVSFGRLLFSLEERMEWIKEINGIVWGMPTLLLIAGVGVKLSICTRFAQFRLLPRALKVFLRGDRMKAGTAGESPFRALCTALAATVGT